MNVDERVLSESVWREWVQRAFYVGFNKIKDYFLPKTLLEKSRIEIEQVVLVT